MKKIFIILSFMVTLLACSDGFLSPDNDDNKENNVEQTEDNNGANENNETNENFNVDIPTDLKGSGSINDPYIISSLGDLIRLKLNTNSGMRYNGEYFLQTSDIVCGKKLLNNDGLPNENESEIEIFYECRNIGDPFMGIYDGGGNTIYGLTGPLFYEIHEGEIKNLTIKDSHIKGNANVLGAFVGSLYNGKISNCNNYAYVEMGQGIVGVCSENSVISKCTNYGFVFGGGLAREIKESIIEESANFGTVFSGGYNYVGGIVNLQYSNSIIESCFNAGNTENTSEHYATHGGLVGVIFSNRCSIKSSINYGSCNTGASGGICGLLKYYLDESTNNYWIETYSHKSSYEIDTRATTSTSVLSAKEMKKTEFINMLNKNSGKASLWKTGKSGFPVFSWHE